MLQAAAKRGDESNKRVGYLESENLELHIEVRKLKKSLKDRGSHLGGADSAEDIAYSTSQLYAEKENLQAELSRTQV